MMLHQIKHIKCLEDLGSGIGKPDKELKAGWGFQCADIIGLDFYQQTGLTLTAVALRQSVNGDVVTSQRSMTGMSGHFTGWSLNATKVPPQKIANELKWDLSDLNSKTICCVLYKAKIYGRAVFLNPFEVTVPILDP